MLQGHSRVYRAGSLQQRGPREGGKLVQRPMASRVAERCARWRAYGRDEHLSTVWTPMCCGDRSRRNNTLVFPTRNSVRVGSTASGRDRKGGELEQKTHHEINIFANNQCAPHHHVLVAQIPLLVVLGEHSRTCQDAVCFLRDDRMPEQSIGRHQRKEICCNLGRGRISPSQSGTHSPRAWEV